MLRYIKACFKRKCLPVSGSTVSFSEGGVHPAYGQTALCGCSVLAATPADPKISESAKTACTEVISTARSGRDEQTSNTRTETRTRVCTAQLNDPLTHAVQHYPAAATTPRVRPKYYSEDGLFGSGTATGTRTKCTE